MAKKVDINGFWDIKSNPLTKEGVFMYLGKQIDPNGERWGLDQERIYWVYRPRSEISKEETLKSFDGVPFIDEHDMLGEGCTPSDCKNIAGTIYNVRMKGDTMVGDFKIYSDGIKREISNGKKELSLGYRAEFKKSPGIFKGKAYDFVQVGIVGNHVALVNRGRCGSDVRIFDKSVVCDSLTLEMQNMNKLDELKAILDGIDESMLAKAEKALMAVKDGCSEDEEAKKKAEEEEAAKKKAAEDEAAKKAAEDAAAKEAEEKKAAEDAAEQEKKIAAVKDEAIKSYKEAVALHDQLVPHIGEFVMDGMDTAQAVAEYGCKKLELNVNAGSEIATLTGFLAGRKGKAGKVVTTDEAAKPVHSFDFKAAYLAK